MVSPGPFLHSMFLLPNNELSRSLLGTPGPLLVDSSFDTHLSSAFLLPLAIKTQGGGFREEPYGHCERV